jgi:indolepyruvate ferredoxin oxidoreductase alpha subunit
MKHVGLNVAADVYMNMAITGVHGGMVVAVADDPSMHSSQNEQDSRYYGRFAMLPVLEPADQQEAYQMAISGLELSESTGVPVMIRIPTRLAHSRSGVTSIEKPREENKLSLPSDPWQFMLLPSSARKGYSKLLNKQSRFLSLSEDSVYNRFVDGADKSLGIVCCGIAYNYFRENFPEKSPYPYVKISQYPLPEKLLKQLESQVDEILVIEEGFPLVEEQLKGFFNKGKKVRGRLDGTLPRAGELNPDLVAAALKLNRAGLKPFSEILVNRPPALCKGCGHHDTYRALNEVMDEHGKGKVFSDIGCYTLGALPPYNSIYSCVDMGASVTMAKGAADAGLFPSVAVIGDSTFTHSGITGLLDAVNEQSNIVVVIGDNESISMTGGQDSSAFGRLEAICEGVGVAPDHIHVLEALPKNHSLLVGLLRKEIAFDGVSVIINRRECIQKLARRRK